MTTTFVSRLTPPAGTQGPARWFIFQGDRLLVQPAGDAADAVTVPLLSSTAEVHVSPQRELYLGCLQDGNGQETGCYAAEIDPDAPLPEGFLADGLRGLYGRLDDDAFAVAGRAVQLLAWDRTHRYCGRCGALDREPAARARQALPRAG